jgi:hypothetical protein
MKRLVARHVVISLSFVDPKIRVEKVGVAKALPFKQTFDQALVIFVDQRFLGQIVFIVEF